MVKLIKREVTQEDLDLNPEMVEEGIEVGAIMKLPPLPEKDEMDEEDDEPEEEVENKGDKPITKVIFHIRNSNVPSGQSQRVFEEASHGKDFLKIADTFEASNTLKKPFLKEGTSSVDPINKEEVDACIEFNKNIKHPVLSRVNE